MSEPSSTAAGAGSSAKPFVNKSISIRLDETNYLLWRQQVLFAIDSLALGSHIDGSAVVPSQYLVTNGVRTPNPEFILFKQEDSALCSWLLSSISCSILPSLVNCRTALEIWDKIQQNFSIFSTTKIMHLHCSLKNLRKRDQSMREYLAQIQSICDSLAACGNPLTETMHISTILSGLPSEYEPVVAVITSSQQPYKLDGVCSVLLDTEARQQEVHSIPVNFAQGSFGFGNGFSNNLSCFSNPMLGSWGEFGPAGFVGQASSTDGNGPQGHGNSRRFPQDGFRTQRINPANPTSFQGGRSNFYRGRGGRVFGGRSRPQCQLCGRVGHLVNRCYYRFDQSYDGFYSANFVEEAVDTPGLGSEPSSTQDLGGSVALVSGDFSPIVCEDASWFPDSGATTHLTPDAGVCKGSVLEDVTCLLWNGGALTNVQRSSLNRGSDVTESPVASRSVGVQGQQPSSSGPVDGYALETAAFTLNSVPSKSVQKTPHEMWTGRRPNMSFMKIWGCKAYVKHQMSTKLEPKSEKCTFVGYPKETKGYYFYNENKVFVARTGVFIEKEFLTNSGKGRNIELKEVQQQQDIEPEVEEISQVVEENPTDLETQPLRRSTRERHEPERYGFLVTTHGDVILVDQDEPKTYQEAVASPDSEK
ncbi:hypothetical protein GQ457_08G026280 [Hibiscus cannabinus]